MSDPSLLLQSAVDDRRITAAALVVVHCGKTVLAKGFGRRTPDPASDPVTPDSIFLLASVTKPVTAVALMQLVERGAVDVEAPAHRYLPEFTGGGREKVLVRHLLSHTSGMPDMLPENTALRRAHAPLGAFVAGALRADLLYPPGTNFRYQSMGILLLSEIVERLTGRRFRDILRHRIFEPLDMTRSALGLGPFAISDTAWCGTDPVEEGEAHSFGANSPYWRDQGHPWGGMHASANDLARLLRAVLDGGSLDGGRILAPDTVTRMTRDWNAGLDAPWGLGWGLRDSLVWTPFGRRVSARTFGHQGSTGTVVWADPETDLACVILTNLRVNELLVEVSDAVAHTFA